MEYHFRLHEDAQQGVRRIALKQIDTGMADIANVELDRHEVVHRLRKRCKKQRALLRLVRDCLVGDYRFENAFYRDLSRSLSSLRDAQALLEAFGRILDDFSDRIATNDFRPIREHLAASLEAEVGPDDELNITLERCSKELHRAGERVSTWELNRDGFAAFEPGLIRTFRRIRKAMESARHHRTTENLHEWRKRVKYHWYYTRLFRRMSPRLLKPHRLMSAELGSLLGQDHDLAVLHERLVDATQQFASQNKTRVLEEFLALLVLRREQIQAEAFGVGRQLFAERPRQIASRWREYWDAWQADACPPAERELP